MNIKSFEKYSIFLENTLLHDDVLAIISHYIKNSDDFLVNDNFKSFVRLDKFNDSSVDVLVYCFTSTNDWEEFLTIKENLAVKIKKEVEKIGLGFAFPSQSVYIENLKKEDISKI